MSAGSVESSPLLVGKTPLLRLLGPPRSTPRLRGKTRPRLRWTFPADDEVIGRARLREAGRSTSGTTAGASTGVDAGPARQSGTRRRSRASADASTSTRRRRSPTGASSSGTRRHRLRLRRRTGTCSGRARGTYVYTAAAVWRKTVFVGTCDGTFIAFDARPGARAGVQRAAVDHTARRRCSRPRLLLDLRHVRRRRDAARRSAGRADVRAERAEREVVWRFPDGQYSPVVADGQRIYLAAGQGLRPHSGASLPQPRKLRPAVRELKRAERERRCR